MAYKLLGNGKHWFRIRLPNRKDVARTFDRKSDGERWEREIRQQFDHGHYVKPTKETVAERCDGWLKRLKATVDKHGKPAYRFGTIQNYSIHIERYIKPELGNKRIQRTTILDCEEASLIWAARTSPYTANMVLKTMNSIFGEALRHAVIEVNVSEKAKRLKIETDAEDGVVQPEDVYSEEDLGALIYATEPGTMDRLVIWLGGFCGLRIGEILGFSWPAVGDLKTARQIRVIKNLVAEEKPKSDFPGYGKTGRALKDPKYKSKRTLDVPRELVHDLRLWKLKCPASKPREWAGGEPLAKQLVMVTVDGKPLQKKRAQAMLDAAADSAGLERRTLHRLRHSFASVQFSLGKSLGQVSEMLGHRDVSITARIYTHLMRKESTAIQDMVTSALALAKAKKDNKP